MLSRERKHSLCQRWDLASPAPCSCCPSYSLPLFAVWLVCVPGVASDHRQPSKCISVALFSVSFLSWAGVCISAMQYYPMSSCLTFLPRLTWLYIRGAATCFTSKHKHGTVFDGVILHGTNNTSQGFLVLVKRVQGGGII